MFEGIIFILLMIGVNAIMDLISEIAVLFLGWLFGQIRSFIKQRVGRRVFLCETEEIIRGLREEAQRNGNVADINQIIAQLDGQGVIKGDIDTDDTVDVQIIKADKVEPKVKDLFRKNGKQIIFN